MSMGSCPVQQYVLKVTKDLIEKLEMRHNGEILNLDDICCYDNEIVTLLEKYTANIFMYNATDGDCYDELEDGHMYLLFDICDLFKMKKTKWMKKLIKLKVEPKQKLWTRFS